MHSWRHTPRSLQGSKLERSKVPKQKKGKENQALSDVSKVGSYRCSPYTHWCHPSQNWEVLHVPSLSWCFPWYVWTLTNRNFQLDNEIFIIQQHIVFYYFNKWQIQLIEQLTPEKVFIVRMKNLIMLLLKIGSISTQKIVSNGRIKMNDNLSSGKTLKLDANSIFHIF